MDYEVEELIETLRSYGVLTRDGLLDRSKAAGWHRPDFEAALRRGIESGSIKRLGDDLFELGDDPPERNRSELFSPKFPRP